MKTVFFMATVLLTIWANIALAAPAANDDVVLYYSFNEGTGKDVTDGSGNGLSGKISGSPAWIDGVFGGALKFTGTPNEYVQITEVLPIASGNSTVAMWIRVPSTAAGRVGVVLGNYPDDSGGGSSMELHDDGQMRIWWNNAKPDLYATATDLRDNEWHHIAWVRDKEDDNKFKLYIDAKAETLPDSPLGAGDEQAGFISLHRVGADNRGADSPWLQAAIDDLVIYSRALTVAELEELMARPALAVHPAGKITSTWGCVKLK